MSDITISYKGSSIATMDASGAKTLQTSGKYCEDDITLQYVKPSGGGTEAPWNDVCFWDYDGRCLYSYSAAEFAQLSALPANPSHAGLTAQGWNWTLADAKTHVATYGMLDIGQLYIPTDGKTKLYITIGSMLRPDIHVKFKCSVASALSLDWGDGSAIETNSSTSETTYTHTYAAKGDYVIKISASNATITLGADIMNGPSNQCWSRDSLKAVELGTVTLVENTFRNHTNMETLTFSNSVTYPNNKSFLSNCASLKMIIFPTAYGLGDTSSFNNYKGKAICFAKQASIKAAWDSLSSLTINRYCIPCETSGNQGIRNVHSLRTLWLKGTQTRTQGLTGAWSLEKLTMDSNYTSIVASSMSGLFSLKEVHMLPETPPTLANTSNTFENMKSDCVFYVPYSEDHSILNAYKTASNWLNWADRIQEEPQ